MSLQHMPDNAVITMSFYRLVDRDGSIVAERRNTKGQLLEMLQLLPGGRIEARHYVNCVTEWETEYESG